MALNELQFEVERGKWLVRERYLLCLLPTQTKVAVSPIYNDLTGDEVTRDQALELNAAMLAEQAKVLKAWGIDSP